LILAAVLLTVGVEYKVFGTSKRFDADLNRSAFLYGSEPFPFLDTSAYREMLAHREYRLALSPGVLLPTDLRHVGLTTPQGFDPFVTIQYSALIQRLASFDTDRFIKIDPSNAAALRILGVGYVLTGWESAEFKALGANPDFRALRSTVVYLRPFEYLKAKPPFGWTSEGGSVDCTRWEPEAREFVVRSESGGGFYLAEQRFPGWQATIDGASVPILPWEDAFQSILVPTGEHRVAFTYRSGALTLGGWISLFALLALCALPRLGANRGSR